MRHLRWVLSHEEQFSDTLSFVFVIVRCVLSAALAMCVAAMGAPLVAGAAENGAVVCTVSDSQLNELSGLVVTPEGYAAINDGGDDVTVYLLGPGCEINDTKTWSGSGFDPADPEDLARTSDGTFWVADIGDNEESRQTAAIWRIAPGSDPILYRLRYPDGAHDAEAVLVSNDGFVTIVTKNPIGTANIYTSSEPLLGAKGTYDLTSEGTITFTATDTPGGDSTYGAVNSMVVTGGAISPDGKYVALRTYTDAYEWDVKDGSSISQVLTGASPRRTPLPNEPLGEAIAYSTDSKTLLTLSEGVGESIRQWKPAGRSGAQTPAKKSAETPSSKSNSQPWYSKINLTSLDGAIYATGAFGLLLLAVGIFGIIRHRRRLKKENVVSEGDLQPENNSEESDPPLTQEQPVGAQERRTSPQSQTGEAHSPQGTVYGGGGQQRPSGVYGTPRKVDKPTGTVYGGQS